MLRLVDDAAEHTDAVHDERCDEVAPVELDEICRPAIELPEVVNPQLTQNTRGSTNGRPIAEIRDVWEQIRHQVLAAGLDLTVRIDTPEQMTGDVPSVRSTRPVRARLRRTAFRRAADGTRPLQPSRRYRLAQGCGDRVTRPGERGSRSGRRCLYRLHAQKPGPYGSGFDIARVGGPRSACCCHRRLVGPADPASSVGDLDDVGHAGLGDALHFPVATDTPPFGAAVSPRAQVHSLARRILRSPGRTPTDWLSRGRGPSGTSCR